MKAIVIGCKVWKRLLGGPFASFLNIKASFIIKKHSEQCRQLQNCNRIQHVIKYYNKSVLQDPSLNCLSMGIFKRYIASNLQLFM